VLGYTALETGIRLLPIAGTMVVVAPLSAKISERLGLKLTVGLGILIAASGMFYFSQFADADSSYISLIPGFLILSAGMAVAMTPATDSIMGSVPVSKAGVGSAMNDTTRELGGALGVAVLGTLFNAVYLDRIAELIRNPALQAAPAEALEAIESSIQGAHFVAANIPVPDLAELVTTTANSAFVAGMTEAMTIGSVVMVAAGLFVLAFLPAQIRRPKEAAAETAYAAVLDTSEVAAVSGD
jgi:Na+/melibiose symporter-like transporter